MKTSARNQFDGKVTRIAAGAVNDEVEMTTPGGHRIVATITRESTQSLGLQVGAPAFALVKASSVILATDMGRVRLSTRNQLAGTVASVTPGAVNAEVIVDVPAAGGSGPGLQLAAVVTLESVTHLALAPGASVTALFKASNVILGVGK